MAKPSNKPKAGRPRSTAARQAVLAAAYDIVMTQGVGRLTIERVAQATGVGKPTIYRSWANAQELAMAAFIAQPDDEFSVPANRGSERTRLVAHLRRVIDAFATPRGRQITLTMAAAEQESELAKAFRNQVILKSREVGRTLLESAIECGAVSKRVDLEVALDMVYGPLFFRLLAGHQPLESNLAEVIVSTVFDGIAEG